MKKQTPATGIFLFLALLAGGCAASDLGSLHIKLNHDQSGNIVAIRLVPEPDNHRLKSKATGLSWENDLAINAASGSFDDIELVRLGGITFTITSDAPYLTIRITIPRGEQAAWPALLTITDPIQREKLANALDKNALSEPMKPFLGAGNSKNIGRTLKISITLPGKIIGSMADHEPHECIIEYDKKTATLTLPTKRALEPGPSIEWRITWSTEN